MSEQNYLDCCPDPDLQPVKVNLDTNRETEALCQCKGCGSYWFHRFLEIIKFNGPDDQTVWDSPVTSEEAQRILQAEGRPDLTFLLTRSSFQKDDRGLRRVSGQPDKPCYG
jgi:hypothetical protein